MSLGRMHTCRGRDRSTPASPRPVSMKRSVHGVFPNPVAGGKSREISANGPHNGPHGKSAWGPLVARRF
jgi:hypothetical protein